jgi:hypothetical protein
LKGIFVFYLQRPATAGRPACGRQAWRVLKLLKKFILAKTQRRKELTPWRTTFSGEELRINPFAAWRLCAHYSFLKYLFSQRRGGQACLPKAGAKDVSPAVAKN